MPETDARFFGRDIALVLPRPRIGRAPVLCGYVAGNKGGDGRLGCIIKNCRTLLLPKYPGQPLGKALLALNNAHAQELSWLEPERLKHLAAQAFLARRIGNLDAFLLAFDQEADYDSPNFLWFRSRYPRFVYVDRIVVASSARGRGSARRLYDDLFEHAVKAGHERVVCEVNSRPPNPASDAFHAALGFLELGTASVYNGSRTVRYLSHALSIGRS